MNTSADSELVTEGGTLMFAGLPIDGHSYGLILLEEQIVSTSLVFIITAQSHFLGVLSVLDKEKDQGVKRKLDRLRYA